MPLLHSHGQSQLLAVLPTEEFERISPHLELVTLPLGEMLYEPGEQLQHAYFPTTAVVSLHYVLESGATAESAGVGNEGVVGVALFMGGETTPSSAVVQTAGHAYRLAGRVLKLEFARAGPMQRLLLRYTQALMTQMTQSAVCNRHHSIEQQLCRWLLLTLDRAPSGELVMTQELVASMLGVRREGITEAAGNLQRAGIISYRRGHISVIDRSGLEARVCECYQVVSMELRRLLATYVAASLGRSTPSPCGRDSMLQGPASICEQFRQRVQLLHVLRHDLDDDDERDTEQQPPTPQSQPQNSSEMNTAAGFMLAMRPVSRWSGSVPTWWRSQPSSGDQQRHSTSGTA